MNKQLDLEDHFVLIISTRKITLNSQII